MKFDLERHLDTPARQFAHPTGTVVLRDMTVAQAAEALRGRQVSERVIYFYVVDETDRLCGVLPARALILAGPQERIDAIMSPPIVCRGDQPLREVLAMFARHRYLALPVVDEDDRLVGVIDLDLYSEEAVDRAVAEREADVFQLIGVWMEQYQTGGAMKAYRLRMPWLICNMIGGLLCAGVATLFAGVIAQVALIAAFIPLVLTLCESVAIQSLTLSLQRMHVGTVNWRGLARLGNREMRTALLLSATCAVVVGSVALMWGQNYHHAALVLAGAILVAMCIAAIAGVAVPLSLRLLRLDPRVAAGPVVLMCVDVSALLVYLGLATLILR